MDEFTKKKIEAIDAEISEHYKKVRELSNLKFKFEYQENIELANSLVGKYFKRSISGEIALFHPIEISSEDHQIRIIGFQAQENLYLIGDKSAFFHSREHMSVDDIIRGYEEVGKEEFDTILAEILDFDI